MTASPHVRSRSRRGTAWRPALGALLLVALLAVLPALSMAPASPGAVRAGGVSIEWWYGGLLAPIAGWAITVWALRGPRGTVDAAGAVTARAAEAPEPELDPQR